MSNQPDPTVAAALENDGYVVLPYRRNGDPGNAVEGFDAAGSVSFTVIVDGVELVDDEPGTIDVLVEGSEGEDSWTTVNDFSDLTADNTPAHFRLDSPPPLLRATVTGDAKHVEVRVFPHYGGVAMLDEDGAFTNVTKPVVGTASAAALLAALVELNLVVDDT